jgi:excinuclease UvrABC ATPase subunit
MNKPNCSGACGAGNATTGTDKTAADSAMTMLQTAISVYKNRCTANCAAYQKTCTDAYTTLTMTVASIDSTLARSQCQLLKAEEAVQVQTTNVLLPADASLSALSVVIELRDLAVTKHKVALAAADPEDKALFTAQVAAIDGVYHDAIAAAACSMSIEGEAADAELKAAYAKYDATRI